MPNSQENSIENKKRWGTVLIAIFAVLLLAGLGFAVSKLAGSEPETTGKVRDIFIIVLAFESLLIGVALVILVIQLAVLTNLIQNEVKPILANTKDTVSTIKGTSKFIAERAVQPIIAAGSLFAGVQKLFQLIGFARRKK